MPSSSVPAAVVSRSLSRWREAAAWRGDLVFRQNVRWYLLGPGVVCLGGITREPSSAPQHVNMLPSQHPSYCWQWDKAQPLRGISGSCSCPTSPSCVQHRWARSQEQLCLERLPLTPGAALRFTALSLNRSTREMLLPTATRSGCLKPHLAECTYPAFLSPTFAERELKHKGLKLVTGAPTVPLLQPGHSVPTAHITLKPGLGVFLAQHSCNTGPMARLPSAPALLQCLFF